MLQNDSPYIDPDGAIIIPFNADTKYHFWNGGQPLQDPLMDMNVTENVWRKHTEEKYRGSMV